MQGDIKTDRVEQMKHVHIQVDLHMFSHEYYHFSASIPQLQLLNNQLKDELTIKTNSISFLDKFELDVKAILLSMNSVTGRILSEKQNVSLTSIRNRAIELFAKKNADYGDAFAEYGVLGVIVRIGDKIFRLKTLTDKANKNKQVKDESIKDTLEDLFNYTAMAVMLLNVDK